MICDWWNVLLFLVLSIGHAAFVIAVTNRIHAIPFPVAILHRTRQLHDIILVTLPVLFAWFYGWNGPGLFLGRGQWTELPGFLTGYLYLCLASAVAIPVIAVYRRIRQWPLLISSKVRTVDIATELGYRPIGSGPYRIFTEFPGNECLKLEVCEREIFIPQLPSAWDGMTILHISDLHFIGTIDLPYFKKLAEIAESMPADLVAFTGDLLDREDLISWLPETLARLSAPLGCFFVLGNHDSYLSNVPQIRAELERHGWRDLAGQTHTLPFRGLPLVLCGSERPWMGCQPDLTRAANEGMRFFLSHTPDNFAWARRNQIGLMLAGHNHGGQIRLPLFGPVYSPSVYGAHYASGAFWNSPTFLYVSRGISGRHPLRLNCLPELVRLTLRSQLADH